MRIKLSYSALEYVLRQTPHESGVWGDVHFHTNDDGQPFDAWVVYEQLPYPETLRCDPNRVIFIGGEPESIRHYDPRFLAQFGAVIAPQPLAHTRSIVSQPAIPWWVGVKLTYQPGKCADGYHLNYDQLKVMDSFDKPKLASIICSNKAVTEGHRVRLRLVELLRNRFDGEIDFFGHGFIPVVDKWDALLPYRYHIVLENCRAPHYWTEKLADTYLAGAFPIYCGCPNLSDYFPEGSFRAIDRNDPGTAADIIAETLREDRYSEQAPLIKVARNLVLDRYNLFPMIAGVARQLPSGPVRRVRVNREQDFTDPIARRYKRAVRRLIFGTGPRSG